MISPLANLADISMLRSETKMVNIHSSAMITAAIDSEWSPSPHITPLMSCHELALGMSSLLLTQRGLR